jgi:hypothetical protein
MLCHVMGNGKENRGEDGVYQAESASGGIAARGNCK